MILREEASLKQLPPLSQKIKEHLKAPCVLILTGEMGVGKTTFVQSFASPHHLPTSPTYSLINITGNLVHADFCRIKSEDELNYLELSLYQECQYAFVEWGRPFLSRIKQEFGSRFLYYELKIQEKQQQTAIRKYILSQC